MAYEDFKQQLMRYNHLASLAIDSETEKGTQTNDGFWVCDTNVRHRNNGHGRPQRTNIDPQQVSLMGCANIQRADLIPDGRGDYFVHIRKCDIMPNMPANVSQNMNSYGNRRSMPRSASNGILLRPPQMYPHLSGPPQPPPMMQQTYRPHYPPPPNQQRKRYHHNHRTVNDDPMPENLLGRHHQHRWRFEANGPQHMHQKNARKF